MTGYEVRPAVASPTDIECAARAPRGPRLRQRRRRAAELEDDDEADDAAAPPSRPSRGPLYDMRENDADQLRRRRRGRVGHPARAPGDQGGRRARRLRHPLRAAATRRCASATASTACSRRPPRCPRSAVPAVTSRVKILADLDIAERRIPQDGRISLEVAGKPIDLRVATLPARLRRERRHAHPGPEQGA